MRFGTRLGEICVGVPGKPVSARCGPENETVSVWMLRAVVSAVPAAYVFDDARIV